MYIPLRSCKKSSFYNSLSSQTPFTARHVCLCNNHQKKVTYSLRCLILHTVWSPVVEPALQVNNSWTANSLTTHVYAQLGMGYPISKHYFHSCITFPSTAVYTFVSHTNSMGFKVGFYSVGRYCCGLAAFLWKEMIQAIQCPKTHCVSQRNIYVCLLVWCALVTHTISEGNTTCMFSYMLLNRFL